MKTIETLTCPECPGSRFVAMVHLKTHPNGGTSPVQAGYRCADCNADVNIERLMQKAEREKKQRELDALREELEPETPKLVKTFK